MADIFGILSSNYTAVGLNVSPRSKYVNVDPKSFEGTWTGKYADNSSFSFAISNVNGFRAKVKYQSGSAVKYQDVLIKDNAFRIGDSKFTLARAGVAQVKTVVTSPVDGSNVLNTAYAHQQN
ncbi:MAG: hypothetical protein E6G97_02265 [Alphaproteobacteria bacterium]|nr:MAG: hypothetical protein E6G97_02265 [Alphaproteobacteria bacterium]